MSAMCAPISLPRNCVTSFEYCSVEIFSDPGFISATCPDAVIASMTRHEDKPRRLIFSELTLASLCRERLAGSACPDRKHRRLFLRRRRHTWDPYRPQLRSSGEERIRED